MEKSTRKLLTLAAGIVLSVTCASAQQLREGYVDMGENISSEKFHTLLSNWQPGSQISADDNFFISRVKPKVRFRNKATQVRQNLDATNDKKLVAWVPVGAPDFNALPNGVFDSEVFSMWSYVTHWGNWTAPLGRIPAAFLDVAHKNGVAVSGVAGVPFGGISSAYSDMLTNLAATDVDKTAKFFNYYGIDGLGYNSEFSAATSIVQNLYKFHGKLVAKMRETNPIFENMWYDGTNDYGQITFDRGLGGHNQNTFGPGTEPRTSLFLNYNWNSTNLLSSSEVKADALGRDPLDLYCGVNMQGGEPRSGSFWSLLPDYRLSIGLWGAHSNNMFWESRGEKGSAPDVKQDTYLKRIERYFTGGSRNPANCPPIVNRHQYNADNTQWHGMSTYMTARSVLSWDLGEEPFITHFNVGNGKYFNYNGVRQHSKEWYNVGMQDYMPTWRFWFASKLLGNTAADVPATGLDANITWDDAYFGGSTIRISGTTADEYLHLFKTEYALKAGDVITFKYKLNGGKAKMNLLLSAKGSETSANEYNLLDVTQNADNEEWIEKTFLVASDFDGKDLALVALHFEDAANLDLVLGEFSIVRGTYATPEAPEVTSAEILYNCKDGKDAKIIWNMPNDKAAGEPCYNLDVKTAYFKLYAQEEGQEPRLMGTTTSWAGLYFAIPTTDSNARLRLGVSAVALDEKSESEVAWSDYMDVPAYVIDDNVAVDKTTIKPNESFTMSYIDPMHEAGEWKLYDADGNEVFSGSGNSVTLEDGIATIGSYDLKLNGKVGDAVQERSYPGFVQITGESVGAVPEIYSLTANDAEADIQISAGDEVMMKYTGRAADGAGSQGVDLKENRFGAKAADLDLVGAKTFSVAFWLKINQLAEGETQLFSVANKLDSWPKTDWGWLWSNINQDGSLSSFTFRGTDATSNKELRYKFANSKLPVGTWAHIAYVFEYNAQGHLHCDFYINGKKQEVTGWNRSTNGDNYFPGDPGFQSDVYKITDGQVLAVAGNAFGRNGIDGTIDNFQVWNKAMTEADVKLAMGDIDPNALPAGLMAYWDLENAAADDFTFASVGPKAGVAAGIHSYEAGEGEGQGYFHWTEPEYTSGCPFIAGTAFEVVTKPSWQAAKAEVLESEGTGESGSAKLKYYKNGFRTVTLTLANSLGKAERTFATITVGDPTGIFNVENGAGLNAYTVDGGLIVSFAEAGNYEVSVFNANGQALAAKAANVDVAQSMTVNLNKSGVYVVSIKKDGKLVRTVKLIRK